MPSLAAMYNLATSYDDAGRQEDALRIRDDVVTASREVNGPEHPDTLSAMNNLGISYEKAGRKDDALALQEEVMKLMLKVNGPKHTETLTAMTNLAISFGRAGHLEKALKMNEEVLNLRRDADGPDHPETLMAMTELAVSYGKGNRMAEGIAMQESALAAMRRVLPPEHPYLAFALQTMASLYWKADRREEAARLRLEREALDGKREVVHSAQNESATKVPAGSPTAKQDLKLLEETLEKLRKAKNPEPTMMIAAMTELAAAYGADGSGRKSITLGEEALKLARRVLPAGDKQTVHAMKVLVALYKSVDLDEDARKLEAEMKSPVAEAQK